MKKSLWVLIAMILLLPLGAYADTLNLGFVGWDANATFTQVSGSPNTFHLDFRFDNTTASTTFYVENFTLQLFNPANPASGGFSLTSGGPTQNGFAITSNAGVNNGNGLCKNVNQNYGWLCGSLAPNQYAVAAGSSLIFSFDGTYTTATPTSPILHLQASGTIPGQTANQWAVSEPMRQSTPEPASIALLSAGLIGLGGLVRRRK